MDADPLARLWSARISAAERPPPFALRGGGRAPGLGRAPPPNERLGCCEGGGATKGNGNGGGGPSLQRALARWWARDAPARGFAARLPCSSSSSALPPGALAWARGGAYLEAGRPEQAHRDGMAALALAQAAAAAKAAATAASGEEAPSPEAMMLALAHALCGSALEELASRPPPEGEGEEDEEDEQEEEDDDDSSSSDEDGGANPAPRTLRARLCLSRAALHAAEAAEASGGLLPGPSAGLLRRLPSSHRQVLTGAATAAAAERPLLPPGPSAAAAAAATPTTTTSAAVRLRACLAADARERLPLIMRPAPLGAPDGGRYRFFRALAYKRLAALFPAAIAGDDNGGDDGTAADVDDEAALLARIALPPCVARRMVDGADAGDLDLMLQHPALAAAQAAELLTLLLLSSSAALSSSGEGGEGEGGEAAVAAHPIAPLSWREVQAVEGRAAVGLSLGHEVGAGAAAREARMLRRAAEEAATGGLAVASAASSSSRALAAASSSSSSLAPGPMALVRLFSPNPSPSSPPSRADLLLALEMACPLRVVLIAASLLLAWLAWWRASAEEEQERAAATVAALAGEGGDGNGDGGKGNDQSSSWATWKARGGVLVDMASGRYLYRAWKESQQQQQQQQQQAAPSSPARGTARRRTTARR